MSISVSLNLAGFPLGSALAGRMSSLSTTVLLAGIAAVVAAISTISIHFDAKAVADQMLFSGKRRDVLNISSIKS
ncbi:MULTISPECIES: hypothetical protein [Rhizobium/Agrobacterium group]|uniref:hypothetical protein n=1 Tax=Rhizobium/Agrobacterium group TaxID=227290 RepID=UPI001AD98935|nr:MULTISPECIES: hypothetical protein [Rhizobium/Agrobacterium group]MBO9112649.1 hypothetical protein [Agrobacterium sp. S2/73]QXZ76143.1 hypothetical protein J5276_24510 [Agrobacterium sp. S7/73]QYA17309.1 hypothetical protein J5284_32210 [Rhizobium sp. AB2/73]UEQ85574.1 hypothetical protein I8E17_31850 [Rhizobium sp. AB2/73]